jgi:hypothetical protein
VPPKVWEQVKASGKTPVEFTYRYNPQSATSHYRVALEPDGATVDVTALGLRAEGVRGKVVIEDDVVRLAGLRGQALAGEVRADAELDFRGDRPRLQFTVKVGGLDLKLLPALWNLPPRLRKLTGRLSGEARLVVSLDGEIETSGEGSGVISDVRIAELPADPIRLRLLATGRGFRFHQPDAPPDPDGDAPPDEVRAAVAALTTLFLCGPDPPPPRTALDLPFARDLLYGLPRAVRRIVDEVLQAG